MQAAFGIQNAIDKSLFSQLIAMTMATVAFAVEVSPEQAQTAVRNWIRKNPQPMTARFTTGNGEAKTISKDGKALFHVVELEGGGFVVTSGDTKVSPIVAFSDDGEFDFSEDNPLASVLKADLSKRASAISAGTAQSPSGLRQAAAAASSGKTAAEEEWDDLLEEEAELATVRRAAASTGTPDSNMSDIRVAPLIKTKWSQSAWGDCTDIPVYNKYTPSNYVCGCVATAGAQIMKYWGMPTKPVTAGTYSCKVNGVAKNLKMKGGTYDWTNMPLSYEATPNISAKQIEAIGKLTYDVGVAAKMKYTAGGSGTGHTPFINNFKDLFGYTSAMGYSCNLRYNESLRDYEQLFNAVFASLDAKCPVAVFIYGDPKGGGDRGGHCVLFDGYGFVKNREYVHINFGWSGACNMWYDVFGDKIDSSKEGPAYLWDQLTFVGYNIHPTEKGPVISGRVLDSAGNPVVNADVVLAGAGIASMTKKSDEKGKWYFRVSKPMSYAVYAKKDSQVSKTNSVEVCQESSISYAFTDTDGNDRYYVGVVANKWGIDLTLESAGEVIPDNPVLQQVSAPVFSPAAGSFTSSSLSVTLSCGTSGATIYYTKNGATPTTSSTKYTGPVSITGTTTFKAIAVKSGMANSDVAIKTYTKQSKPTITVAQGMDWSGTVTVSSSTAVYGQDEFTHDGKDATTLKQDTSTFFPSAVTASMSVSGPGVLSFWWAGDAKSISYSYFSFLIDGTEKAKRGMGTNWKNISVPLAAGNHTIQWKVDASIFGSGQGLSSISGHIDEVSFTPYSGGTCKVVFDGNGATGSAPATISAAFADSIKLPDCGSLRKDDAVFLGWATSGNASKAEYFSGGSFDILAQTTRLYAVWKPLIEVLVEIPQGGGDIEKPVSCYGNSFTAFINKPEWAGSFKMRGKTSGGTTSLSLGNGTSNLSIEGDLVVIFSAEANDTAEDRSFDLDMDAKNYPYVIRFHVVQKADVVSDKPKGLVVDGAMSVVSSSGANYSCEVVRRNGNVSIVSPTWSVAGGGSYASVSSSGKLTAKKVTAPQTVVLRATYAEGGITCTEDREVAILPTCALSTALDNDSLAFQTGSGGNAWSGQYDVSNDGVDAARASSALGGTPFIKTNVNGPAVVSFDCLMSADGGNTLYFVDNGETNECAYSVEGTIPSWQHRRFTLREEGTHAVELVYKHEGGSTGVAGADAAWVDCFTVADPQTYVVTYKPGAKGTGSQQTANKVEDATLTLEGAIFTRTGYKQDGWSKTDGGAKDFGLGGSYTANADATLYPHWIANTYTVTLNRQSGSGGSASAKATYGAAMPSITLPTRIGYTFGGYYTAANGGGTQYYTATGASARNWNKAAATTLYAYWMKALPLPVYRFYSKAYKGHFFTIDEAEKDELIAHNPNWKFEGTAYRAYTNEASRTVALYRFYSKGYRGHFFTIDAAEAETVKRNPNWKYEGIAYYVYPDKVEGSVPVFRFWSKGYRHHFYTTNEEEADTIKRTNKNWAYEGVAFYALPAEEARSAAKSTGFDGNNDRNDEDNNENDEIAISAINAINAINNGDANGFSSSICASPEVGGVAAPWSLAAWPDCEPVATEGETAICGLVVEASADAPDAEDLLGGDGSTSRPLGVDASLTGALPLLLSLPDGAWRATLRSAVDGNIADEEAAGVLGFALPANGAWHRLRVRDAEKEAASDADAFSLWLRAE